MNTSVCVQAKSDFSCSVRTFKRWLTVAWRNTGWDSLPIRHMSNSKIVGFYITHDATTTLGPHILRGPKYPMFVIRDFASKFVVQTFGLKLVLTEPNLNKPYWCHEDCSLMLPQSQRGHSATVFTARVVFLVTSIFTLTCKISELPL